MRTHYDILNLDKNCSAKEIKESFLNLSKIYHPDVNKNSDAQKKFVEINEAYSVLGKPDKRHQYDEALLGQHRMEYRGAHSYRPESYYYYVKTHARNSKYPFTNTRAESASKLKLLFFCCFLIVIGSGIQVSGIIRSRYRQTQRIEASLKEMKERNHSNLTKEQKIELIHQMFNKNKTKEVNIPKE